MTDNSSTDIHTARPAKTRTLWVKYLRIKRRVLSRVLLVRLFIIGLTLTALVLITILGIRLSARFNLRLYFDVAYNFMTAPVSQLASNHGRTNILIMGKAGGDHDGPDLTDTMMLVSVSLDSPDVRIVSIPRDLWLPDIRAKVNSAYYWGNEKGVGGINFAKAEVSQVVGQPIHYGAVIDFSGFKEIIDVIGGVQVDVENSFTDYFYPIAGREDDTCGGRDPIFMCRYETLSFSQGKQLMDGETALKFVRSRHAEGIEGTDIARASRQQKVIDAVRNKLSDKNTYMDMRKDLAILAVVLRSVQTDLDYPTAAIVARRFYDSKDSINSFIIPTELLVNPPISARYDLQSVFIPTAGSGKWAEINEWFSVILK